MATEMISSNGLACCLNATALYLIGSNIGRDAEILKSVTRVNQLKDLAGLLDTACNVLPAVVTVTGRVGLETPINCEQSRLRGVIVKAEQHFLKRNDAGSWVRHSAPMLSTSKEDDGTARVFVVGAQGARGFVLTAAATKVFEESGHSCVCGTLDCQGLKMLGVKRTERILPAGTALTVVGEAVEDDVGKIQIQRPRKGPFYVSPDTIDQLISNHGKFARRCKIASVGFLLFGAYLQAKHAL